MAEVSDKENRSPSRQSYYGLKRASASPSPAKGTKKGRSKSIGPGGLDGALDEHVRESPNKNRRKSSFAPFVKSILPSKEDEAKRREARRKSLANRRVSFAPEATLHTWDVIEYMRDATTSSSSFENTRRASAYTEQNSDQADPPSTPPDQADEPTSTATSPAHQRDLHQKKLRRHSGVPPLNFNDPDEDFSSSPASGSSPESGSDAEEDEEDGEDSEDDGEGTAMSLDVTENTADMTLRSEVSQSSSDSSARLDAALNMAAQQAGTRGIEYDEHGEMSMELATEEVTNAFKPWADQKVGLTSMAKNLMAVQDQENINPFSPAFRAHLGPKPPSAIIEHEEENDMSMDMTRAVGGIIGTRQTSHESELMEDETMDFTQVGGKILQPVPMRVPQLKSALKRRLPTTENGSSAAVPIFAGSPVKQLPPRVTKRRRSSADRSSMGDATMDLTTTMEAVQDATSGDATMDFTTAVGVIQNSGSPVKQRRRTSLGRRRSSGQSSVANEQTMDFTMAVGGIRQVGPSPKRARFSGSMLDENEELSMELTTAIGDIFTPVEEMEDIPRPVTPCNNSPPPRTAVPATPNDQDRFKEANDVSARKPLTPIFEQQAELLPVGQSPKSRKNTGSARKSARKSLAADVLRSEQETTASETLSEDHASPAQKETPRGTSQYPDLPAVNTMMTPRSSPRSTRSRSRQETPATPVHELVAQQDVPSPILEKQLRSSPSRGGLTPQRSSVGPNIRTISDSIRLLSTPRKDTGTSPLKRLKELTPKRTPVRKIATPKLKTPVASAKKEHVDPVSRQLSDDLLRTVKSSEIVDPIGLNEFLDMAGIRFMELTTTKRRYTTAATLAKVKGARDVDMTGIEEEDPSRMLEDALVAGACTVPELDLYQHSCRELKRYIAEGKTFLKNLEADVYRDPPPLIQAYLSASPERKSKLDAHMRDAKTQARLQSKEIWYGWRSQLLEGLEEGLRSIRKGLEDDLSVLTDRESIVESTLPALLVQQESMQVEAERLVDAAAAIPDGEKQELSEARESLAEVTLAMDERRQLLESLQQELEEQENFAEVYVESKLESLGAIEEAERMKQACRGWSVDEVANLKASVAQLDSTTGWTIDSASSNALTMSYRSELQFFFDPLAFLPGSSSKNFRNQSPRKSENRPISLIYTADTHEHRPQPLTTCKRFFLQFMRAQLQCLVQHQTTTKDLLTFISSSWDTASKVHETLRRLEMEYPLDVYILSDERLGIELSMLLPKVETKVRIAFEVCALIATAGDGEAFAVQTGVKVTGKVVYGEKYKEGKMGEYILSLMGGEGLQGAEGAVRELKARLVATGRKAG